MAALEETQAQNPSSPPINEISSPPVMPDQAPVTTTPRTQGTSLEPVAQSHSPPGQETTQNEPHLDPTVAVLQGMFPDFDSSLLQSVLESVGGDQERAIDILLGMSDPSYKPQVRNDLTQTELDEQFARTLVLEEESRQHPAWRPNEPPVQGVPYTARRDGPHQRPTPTRQGSGEGDGIAQIQEQLGKFAETGKRTFNTLLSKVKAKIQEFDSPAGAQSEPSSSAHHPLPHGDSWSTTAQSQAYYNPNQPVHGYEVNPAAGNQFHATPVASQPAEVPVHPSSATMEAAAATGTSSPPASNTVDPAKIGLLPKRPVSLGSSPQPSRVGDDDDDLEYVENPFEESKNR